MFYLKGAMAGVLETQAYVSAGLKPDFATQSGPMLVIDGKLHPRFLPDSDSLKRRNGVGVSRDGMVHFAISENTVRFTTSRRCSGMRWMRQTRCISTGRFPVSTFLR